MHARRPDGEGVSDGAVTYAVALRRNPTPTRAPRRQLLIDCEAKVAETHRIVTEKRERLKERQRRATLLHEKLQGQEQLRTQMQANLKQREVAQKERAFHEVASRLREHLGSLQAAGEKAERDIHHLNKAST